MVHQPSRDQKADQKQIRLGVIVYSDCRRFDGTVDDKISCVTFMFLDYGKNGIFLIMGNAGALSSTVGAATPTTRRSFGFRLPGSSRKP